MLSALAAVPGEALCLVFQRGHHRYFGKSLFLNYRFPEPSEEMYLFCLVKFSAEKNSCLLSLLPPTEKNKDHSALPLASVKSLHRNCLMRLCFSCIDPVVLFVQENQKPISSNTSSQVYMALMPCPGKVENEESARIDMSKVMEVMTGCELSLVLAMRSQQYPVCSTSSTF